MKQKPESLKLLSPTMSLEKSCRVPEAICISGLLLPARPTTSLDASASFETTRWRDGGKDASKDTWGSLTSFPGSWTVGVLECKRV